MISALRSSFASVIRKTLRYFRMESVPADPFGFEKPDFDGTNIERYIVSLVNGYNAHDTTRMKQYKVHALYHCKECTGVGHEYASVKVVGLESEQPFYIVFERFRGPIDPDKPTNSTEQAQVETQALAVTQALAIVHSSSDSIARTVNLSKESSPSLQDRLADDRASISLAPRKNEKLDEIHKTIEFQKPVPLYAVAVLAATVHRFQVKYELSYASCYFYAATIMTVMEQLHSSEIKRIHKAQSTQTELGRVPKTVVSGIYSAPKLQPEAMETIIASYKTDLALFVTNASTKNSQLTQAIERAERAEAELARFRAERHGIDLH